MNPIELWYRALRSSKGIKITLQEDLSPNDKSQLYAARKKLADPDLSDLTIKLSTNPKEFYIVPKSILQEAKQCQTLK